MPIYEYRCDDCGERLEKLQRMSDAPLTDCPACGKPALKRLVSAAGFRLKGGGWYETDFKQGNRRNVAGSDSDGGDSKADSKADRKADGKGDKVASGKDATGGGSGKTPSGAGSSKPAAGAGSGNNKAPA